MAQGFAVTLTNNATYIFSGWSDPKILQFWALLPDWVKKEYQKRHEQRGATPTQPAPSTGGPPGSGSTPTPPKPVPAQPGPQTLDNVDLGVPQIGPGGQGVDYGQEQEQALLNPRANEFLGIDTANPSQQLPPNASPYSINFDSIQTPGSLCVRKGFMKLSDDRDTVQKVASPLDPTDLGMGFAHIPANDEMGSASVSGALLLAFGESHTIGGASDNTFSVVKSGPRWSDQKDLHDAPGPGVTISSATPTEVDIQVTYPRHPFHQHNVVAVIARYSTIGYPLDYEGEIDDRQSLIFGALDRTEWDGSTLSGNQTGLTTGETVYVTVWALSREGISRPSFRKVVVS